MLRSNQLSYITKGMALKHTKPKIIHNKRTTDRPCSAVCACLTGAPVLERVRDNAAVSF